MVAAANGMATAANGMITATDGYKVYALAVHNELKEDAEELELYIRIGRKNGIFYPTSDRCPCVREDTCELLYSYYFGDNILMW